jgi:hypothetical protein
MICRFVTTPALLAMISIYGCGAADPSSENALSSTSPPETAEAPAIAGTYSYQINTRRGPIVGTWSFHDDGSFFDLSNDTEIPAGTWTSDGTNISLVENIPYGNVCQCTAPITATGFSSREAPSTDITCTFNSLKPNPRSSWYAIKRP